MVGLRKDRESDYKKTGKLYPNTIADTKKYSFFTEVKGEKI